MDIELSHRDCYLKSAIPIFRALNEGFEERSFSSARRRTVMQIATNLALTHHTLESIPVYWIEPEVDELCKALLINFAHIDTWAQNWPSNGSLYGIQTFFEKSVYTKDRLKKGSITAFFKAEDNERLINTIDKNCSRLYEIIDDSNDDSGSVLANFSLGSTNDVADFGRNLINALELHIKCNPKELSNTDDHQSQAWHPTRLCLMEEEHKSPSISLLVAPMKMSHWQDCHLIIEPEDSTVVNKNASPQPAFSNLVDRQECARVEIGFNPSDSQFHFHKNNFLEFEPGPGRGECLADVLSEYQLMSKEKVILAYAIAQAYHRFYDSDLMRTKWTSNSIWFMPPTVGSDEIPLRPYLIFPFGFQDDPEEDFIDHPRLVHKHPRMLAFGILLLEIGLSKPFQSIPQCDSISQANSDHRIAFNSLKHLKDVEWDGFTHKSLFDKAVEYCIRQGRLTVDERNELGPVGKDTDSQANPLLDKKQGILARRRNFFKNVVLPLKYIAEKGFNYQTGNELNIRRKTRTDPSSTELPNQLSMLEASFHSARVVQPVKWLEHLNLIGNMVERQRRRHKLKSGIRVAILDTGIDKDNTSRCITLTRDFVDDLAIEMTDTFGHGTLMARLVTICAPSAEIIVARVAKSIKDLEVSQENIRDAIIWARVVITHGF